jgi:hypothetical protein
LKVLLHHKTVVLVLVHPWYFISPVPTVSGEPPGEKSPMEDQQHLTGEALWGHLNSFHYKIKYRIFFYAYLMTETVVELSHK